MKPLIITTGDTDGIGLEVTQKALKKARLPKTRPLVIFVPKGTPRNWKRLHPRFKQCLFLNDILEVPATLQSSDTNSIIIESEQSPAHWVEEAGSYCLRIGGALVTAPLSKTLIQNSGLNDMGHTGILQRITKVKNVYMCFLGSELNVLLGSGHMALEEVPNFWNQQNLNSALSAALKLRKIMKWRKPIGALGLNPHSGEDGMLGMQEKSWMKHVLSATRFVEGPLVPDAAFKPSVRGKYCLYIALYHDQGLIPFKAIHGESGVHLSWGLPFIRTSVDHGTAKDIFGKNKANPQSMIDALEWAHKLEKAGVIL